MQAWEHKLVVLDRDCLLSSVCVSDLELLVVFISSFSPKNIAYCHDKHFYQAHLQLIQKW